jgi:hypothetical protein
VAGPKPSISTATGATRPPRWRACHWGSVHRSNTVGHL